MIQCVSDWNPYDDMPDDYPIYNCHTCGGFLKHEPEKTETRDQVDEVEDINGEMIEERNYWVEHTRTCTKCGAINVESDC